MLDFSGFRSEVKKAFEIEIPVKGRDSWEKYLAEKSAEVIRLFLPRAAAGRRAVS